ncbi:lipase [Camelimonas fluminis]|uniref:Alpha/beta hydrolase family protein n=1 Tax=Camelimonas fluminis TaxID=1576911 RepID=A0ABV7ULS8_9HYPH|nr:alpha/beta fold hydrolase [Camelimonas fluminis]GHE56609.1 lipase [Camelimonas fluminis]
MLKYFRLYILTFIHCLAFIPTSISRPLEGFDLALAHEPPFPVTAFYETPADITSLPAGTVIRSDIIAGPGNAVAWRVLYVSERWNGERVPASGLVLTPLVKQGGERRGTIAWAHGTTGAARGCAPSLAPNPARELTQRGGEERLPIDIGIPFLADWLARGYTVVAPDYAGLGSNTAHHYMVGDDEARDVHNLVRASRAITGTGHGDDIALIGWSQGGHAVLFAGEIGPAYAPDNAIRAIVALAPGSTVIMAPEQTNAFFAAKTPYPYLIGQSYLDAYKLDPRLFTKVGHKNLAAARKGCVVSLFRDVSRNPGDGLAGPVMNNPDWVSALTRNNAGLNPSQTPVFIVHGRSDTVVPPAATTAFVERARQAGTDVTVHWIDNAGHRDLFRTAKADIINWIERSLARPDALRK